MESIFNIFESFFKYSAWTISDKIQFYCGLLTGVSLALVAWQAYLQRKAVQAQTRATEIETYVNVNIEFLNTIDKFSSKINTAKTLKDLKDEEVRAIDRYFYLANIEYIMISEKIVKNGLKEHWEKGIKSGAKNPLFRQRWEDKAQNFSFNEKFKTFFNQSITENDLKIKQENELKLRQENELKKNQQDT